LRAIRLTAYALHFLAKVASLLQAHVARPTRQVRQHRYSLAQWDVVNPFTELADDAGKLVAHDYWRRTERVQALEYGQVRTAHPAALDLNLYFTFSRMRDFNMLYQNLLWFYKHRPLHWRLL
jgi:hypothetical protein